MSTQAYKRSSACYVRVCVSLCMSVPSITQKRMILKLAKVFKLGIGNDLGISENDMGFGVERSKVKVTGSQSAKHIEGGRVAGVRCALYRVPCSL